jgi:hypothetical protein
MTSIEPGGRYTAGKQILLQGLPVFPLLSGTLLLPIETLGVFVAYLIERNACVQQPDMHTAFAGLA